MHRIAARAGGWTPDTEGVIVIEQTSAPIVLLTSADTDIQTLATATARLPDDWTEIRAVNILQLQQQFSIDRYADAVLVPARVIVLRLLGGRSYWSYGLEVVKETVEETGAALFVLPGDDKPDLELMDHSTVPRPAVDRLWRYFTEAGVDNWINALKFISDTCLGTAYNSPPPREVARVGRYGDFDAGDPPLAGRVGILFYRSHYLAGNTLAIDALVEATLARGLRPLPLYVSSLREPGEREAIGREFSGKVDIVLDTTSFAIARPDAGDESSFWQELGVPVLQAIASSGTLESWEESYRGLSPRDVAINVALPEMDGKIITRAVCWKAVQTWQEKLETDLVIYKPLPDRIDFVVELASHWVRLRHTPDPEKKIALVLANYPNKDGRLANGVGLDTPASCVEILRALRESGYTVPDIPRDGEELIRRLVKGVTNDRESRHLKSVERVLSLEEYRDYLQTLPASARDAIETRWGNPTADFPIAGITLGNVFIGIQPSRGHDIDPSLNYHAPDLEPTHDYLAFYYWLREKFRALAVVHVGKHGNLEWLPGKSLALSRLCYPEIALQTLPHFYPFIVNDPGEGSCAKRRSHAVIIDHLTPPITRAELYGDLERMEALIDEYHEAQSLDPSRLPRISALIARLARQAELHRDLGFDTLGDDSFPRFLSLADGYLCELKEARIRDGLHILGRCPEGTPWRDLLASIARFPGPGRLGLTRSIARDLNLPLDPLTEAGDETTRVELLALDLIEKKASPPGENSRRELDWIDNTLVPALKRTPEEISRLLDGLAGRYVPAGPSGAPTRGRPEVLPTGRNFYSVDIRSVPTETAWEVGRKAAEELIERYAQENGEYPKTLAISIWGTSTMRTGGDDVAQVLALLGVRPVWDGFSRRVTGYEILTPSALGRPRVDVTVRVSGFFRDSFPNLLHLLNFAINEVASQEEGEEINPLASKVSAEREFWRNEGLDEESVELRASARIFGSKPGAYGAGLQGLIESQNWRDDSDLARAYINWSCHAYDGRGMGHSLPAVFARRLQQLQVVLHNQDNREHDLLDADDYYQFQGGLIASARALTGRSPQAYFGDNSLPELPKVRGLQEEIRRVYRSRVVNPKWIEGVLRHGYKGAFEMAATVDYLFAYDATARVVDDFMYRGVAEAYLFDERTRSFLEEKNPHALRDMAERLLEARQRGLWQDADAGTLERLRALVHEAEGLIEGGGD